MLVKYFIAKHFVFIGVDIFSKSQIFHKKFSRIYLVMLSFVSWCYFKKIFSGLLHMSSFMMLWVNHGPLVEGISLLG